MTVKDYNAIHLKCFGESVQHKDFILRTALLHQCKKAQMTNLARRIESLKEAQLEMDEVIESLLGDCHL